MAWSFYDQNGKVLQGVLAVSIDTTELADDAVTTAKIVNDAVTYAKMQNLATADRVLGSESTGVIGEVQIVPDMIASNAVTTAKILDANVTLAKVASQAANTVLVRDANSSGVVSAKAVADTQILIGDGTGFTAAALSGEATMSNAGAVLIADNIIDEANLKSDNNPTNDHVLTAKSSASGGLTWAAAGAFPYSSATVASIEATTSTHNDRIPSMYVTANDSGDMVDGFGPQIIFRATDSGATNQALGQMSFERSGADNSGKFRLQSKVAGADNTLMVIFPTGEMQLPDQPSFGCYATTGQNNITGNGGNHDMLWDEQWDIGSNFNAATETFTCPVDGRYLMLVWIEPDGINGANQADVKIMNSAGTDWTNVTKLSGLPSGNTNQSVHALVIIDADANDAITIRLQITGMSAGNNVDILEGNRTHWTGHLLG